MKNSKKKSLLFEAGKRRYANKPAFQLYPDFNEYIGPKRDKYGNRLSCWEKVRHLWRGNRHALRATS